MSARAVVLVIAGADSSGEAGLARDLWTLGACGVDAAVALTAVTVQSDARVHAIHALPSAVVRDQIATVLATRNVRAIKIGMLATAATVAAVADCLPPQHRVPVVLDPVFVSSSGFALLDAPGVDAVRARLLPQVTLVTPNIPEAAMLLDEDAVADHRSVLEQARRLHRLTGAAVLLKGGHSAGSHASDCLLEATGSVSWLHAPRVAAQVRGTGCALATAIAAGLAHRLPLLHACARAKRRVTRLLQAAH